MANADRANSSVKVELERLQKENAKLKSENDRLISRLAGRIEEKGISDFLCGTAGIGYFEIDLKSGAAIWHKKTYEIFGIPPETTPPTLYKLREHIYKDDIQKVYDSINAVITRNENFDLIYRILTPDAKVKYVRTKSDIVIEKGKAVKIRAMLQDIDEIERRRLKMQESLDIMERFAEITPSILYIYDLETDKNVYINRRFTEHLGYSTQDLEKMGENVLFKLLHPEDSKRLGDMKKKFDNLEDGKVVEEIYRMKHKNGSWRYIADKASVFSRNPDGSPKMIIGMDNDITELHNAQEEIKRNQIFLENIIDSSPNIVYIFDLINQKNIYVNSRIENILGYTPKQIHDMGGNFLRKLLHPDDLKIIELNLEWFAEAEDDDFLEREYRLKHAKGHWLWFSAREKIFRRDQKERAVEIFGVLCDITENKLSAQKLADEKNKYITLIENMTDIVCEVNTEGRFLFISPSYHQTLGYTEKDLIGKQAEELLHPDDLPAAREKLGKMIEKEGSGRHEWRFRNKKGEYLWLECMSKVYKSGGQDRIVCISRDITERKRAEEDLFESREELAELFENTLIGIYKTTPEGIILKANPAIMKMLGYKNLQELQKRNLEKGGYEPDYPRTRFKEMIEKEGIITGLESAWLTKYGDTIFVRESAIAVKDGSGKTVYYQGTVEDITERKEVEEALKKSEKEKSLILNTMSDLFAYYDTNLTIQWANKASCESTGLNQENLTGRKCYEVWQQRTNVCPGCPVKKAIKTKKVHEEVRTTPDGRIWELKGYPVIENGVVTGAIEFGRDVTLEKKIQDTLKKSEEKFRLIFNNAAAGIIYFSRDMQIIDANPAFCQMTGYSLEELKNINSINITHPEDIAKEIKIMKSVSEAGREEYFFEKRYIKKDGATLWVNLFVNLHFTKKPEWDYSVIVVVNIDEKKKAEMALDENRKMLKGFIENSPDGIVIIDEEGRVQEWNIAMEELFRITKEEAAGKYIWDIKYDYSPGNSKSTEKYQELKKRLKYFLKTGISPMVGKIVEREFSDKKGEKKVMQSVVFPIKTDRGFISGSISRDVTLHKKTERKLAESEKKLLEAMEAKDKFFSIIAHDLKAPLSGFLGLTEDLSENFNSLSISEMQEMSRALYHSSGNLYRLLENLLEWAKMQRGAIEYHPQKIDLSEACRNVIDLFRQWTDKKNISVEMKVSEKCTVKADKNMITLVLRNLLNNAVKYSNPGGKVIIGLKEYDENFCEISVSDRGIGISPHIRRKLFRIDEKVSKAGTEGEKGSGLGLILCKDFIERHGGRIWVESEEGKGSDFRFILPQAD